MPFIVRALGALLVYAWTTVASAADLHVAFHAIKDRADVDEAMAFFRENLDPKLYDTSRLNSRTWAPRRRGKSLDVFVRDWVLLAKGDINDDGVEDRFYLFDHPAFCGSIGCELWIVDGRPGGWKALCETYAIAGEGHDVVITERVTVNGFHELRTPELVYWHGDECILDDPRTSDRRRLSHDPLRR